MMPMVVQTMNNKANYNGDEGNEGQENGALS
jgi:hypothetical protein